MKSGEVVKVHALAAFPCDRCGKSCLKLTIAPVVEGRVESPAEKPGGPIVCNDCTRKEFDREKAEYKAAINRRRWAKEHGLPPPRVTRPRGGA